MSFFDTAAPTFQTTTVDMRRSPSACPWCSSRLNATYHSGPCPRIRAIEYFPNGTIKRVEFKDV